MRTLPHPDKLRDLVEKVAWGLAASKVDHDELVLGLPHAAKLSRYASAYIHWSPSIVVVPGAEVNWRTVERGVEQTGAFVAYSPTDITGDYPPGAPAPAINTAKRFIAGGALARFELVNALEHHVSELLEASSRLVAREIEGRLGDESEGWAPTLNHGVADHVALESLATSLLWGTDSQTDSIVLRMVDRAAATHINNQPLGSWFDVNLRARAEEAVRRHIGDPHIGRKIRRLAREQSPESIDELIDMYRRAHPRESVGRDRVIAALSADKTLDSVSHSLSLLTHVAAELEEPHEEEADS